MASSSGGSYTSNQETTNFARLCRIVVDVLRDILWQVLILEIPALDLPNRVRTNQNKLGNLNVKINTWLCGISPSSPEIPIAEKFDVSSLYTLIRNLCSQVPAPSTQWGKSPPPGGTTLGDDIERLREFRNTLFGHATQAKIDTSRFNNLCIEIRNVVSRFDAYFSSSCTAMQCDFQRGIDTILTCSMDKSLQDTYVDKMKEIGILSGMEESDAFLMNQQPIKNGLENVKQQVDNIEHKVDNVEQKVGDVEHKVGNVEQKVGNVEQKVGDVEQKVGNVEQKVGNIEQKVSDVEHTVGNVEQKVGNVEQKVGNVEQKVGNVQQKVSDVEQKVNDVEQKVSDVEHKVGNVEQKVGNVEQKVGDVEQKVGNVEQKVGDVEQKVGSVEQKVGNVEHKVDNVEQKVGDVEQKVGNVEQKVGDIERKVGDVGQKVGNVEQKVGDVEQKVGDVEQKVGNVEQKVGEVGQKVHDVEQKVGSVEQKVGDVQQQVGDVEQKVGNVEQKVGEVEQKFGDVERQVSGLEQHIKEHVGDVKAHLEKEIEEIKESLKKTDVVENVQLFREEKDKVEEVNDSLIDEDPVIPLERTNAGISHHPSQSTNETTSDKRKKGYQILGFPKRQKIAQTTKFKMTSSTDETMTSAAQHSSPKRQKIGDVTKSKMPHNADEITSFLPQRVSCTDPRLLCQILIKSVQDASSSLSTLEGNCQTVGMKFHGVTPRNGNCFFEAVSSQLWRLNCSVQKSPQQLRKDVVAFMQTNRIMHLSDDTIDLAEFIYNENFDDYCLRMLNDGEWADHVVVVAMARMLQIDIMIVTSSPSSGPDCNTVWVVGQANFRGDPILLAHEFEQHYHSLQPIEDFQTSAFVSASDGSDQPISGSEISLQVGEEKLMITTEVSPAFECYNDPEVNPQDPVIPEEILRMDEGSIQMFKEALRDRNEKVYNIRVLVVGQYGVGKTTLTKRLLGDKVNITHRQSTEGIDVHIHRCRVSLATGEWSTQDNDTEQSDKLQRLCKILNDQGQAPNIGFEQMGKSKVMHQMTTASDIKENDIQLIESTNVEEDQKRTKSSSSKPANVFDGDQSNDVDNEVSKASSKAIPGNEESDFSNFVKEDLHQMLEQDVRNADMNEDTVKNILQFLTKNADKLARREEYSPLAMWDFAGQYVYYTTHQTFLTQRAIYLLVIDLTQHATDYVMDDDCFFDIEGEKKCLVHDLVEVWMNSIHSCAPSLESGIPPVILVGTHRDKIQQEKLHERCENIFWQIRSGCLKGRPARFHLADEDFTIDNTFDDPNLKKLQMKIVDLASKQPHWGESIPGRWLPLDERLFSLKASGIKVIPYHLLKKINQEADVRIESKKELDLFLKFHHDTGNILYFRTKELREWIVLEPQWLIRAMKSLITARMFFVRKYPQAELEWYQFEDEGKITQKLLDIVWSKEHEPDLHDYKKLILLLMEQLNIIARPRLFTEDGDKAEDFFLAPCMLRQKTPEDVINPDIKPEIQSSSVLCFVFMGKFLPSPIFHRLLAVCVAKWPILEKMGKKQIFCGCGIFEINRLYRLTLYFKSYAIFARVALVTAKHQEFNAKVCILIREFINDSLSKILGNLSQNLTFELFLHCQCTPSVADCLDNIIPVKELMNVAELNCGYHDHNVESNSLLKYWFQNEELKGMRSPKRQKIGDVTKSKMPHNADEITSFLPQSDANSLYLSVHYRNQGIFEHECKNPDGCRVFHGSGQDLTGQLSEELNEGMFGPPNAEQICLPECNTSNIAQNQSTQMLLKMADRGLLLRVEGNDIIATRKCRCAIFVSSPSIDSRKTFKLARDQPVKIYDYENYFLPAFQIYLQKGNEMKPSTDVVISFGQKFDLPQDHANLLISLTVYHTKAHRQLVTVSCHSQVTPTTEISLSDEYDSYLDGMKRVTLYEHTKHHLPTNSYK